jgi:hypothetical protein
MPPLRQAEEASATSTEEMANPSAPSAFLVDGRFTSSTFFLVLLVVPVSVDGLCVVVVL